MRKVELKITGTTALLMHNVRLANPLNKYSKRISELNTDKKVKGADKESVILEMYRIEWEGGLYHTETEASDDGTGAYLPARNVHKSILEAARMTREGPGIEQGSFSIGGKFRLEYDGPRSVADLYADGRFLDLQTVTVGASKVTRARARFDAWGCTASFMVDPDVCKPERFAELAAKAGAYKGVGDGHKGIFAAGRYTVELVG